MRVALALLLLAPLARAGEGAWQASGAGVTISHRGFVTASPALRTSAAMAGEITLVAWRYRLDAATPILLQARLCAASRCISLTRQNGSSQAFAGLPASTPFRFIWQIPGRGTVQPAIRVLSQQVIVNYTTTGDSG